MEDRSIEVARLMNEITHKMRRNMKRGFEENGITMPQMMVIGQLHREQKMTVSSLGKHLGMTVSTLSGILDRLEKQGVVRRVRSEEDKRVVYVELSEVFKRKHESFHEQVNENISRVLSKGTPEELDTIYTGLKLLDRIISESIEELIPPEGEKFWKLKAEKEQE